MSFICEHCKGKFNDEIKILDNKNHEFCCNGCKNVYVFLQTNGFDEFYSRLGKSAHTKASEQHFSDESASSLFSCLINRDKEKPYICELLLLIDGVHCSACIWLNERALSTLEGILEIQITANAKARILYDERKIKLSNILNHIIAIGYTPKPFANVSKEINKISREYYIKLIVAIACTMNIMWVAIALYSGYFSGIDASTKKLLHFAEFVLASPVVFYTGSVFFSSALNGLKARHITMDFNLSLGILGIYFYSVYAMLKNNAEVYFDSACMLVAFIFIGKFLQTLASKKAALGLEGISSLFTSKVYSAKNCNFNDFKELKFEYKDVKSILKDDFIMLRAGERAMIDGIVAQGLASIDNSSISGESLPITLKSGDEVLSGALCVEGNIIYKAKASFEGSFLSKLANMLSLAEFKKPQIEQRVNEIAGKFSLFVFFLCVLTFIYWYFVGANALAIAISVLVIACPCALSLATPIATLVALGNAFKKGIVFKEAKIIESLAKCKIIAFDKTGTLSLARLRVCKEEYFFDFDKNLLFSLLSASSHPISVALAQHFKECELKELSSVQNLVGFGISGEYKNLKLYGGSAKFALKFANFKNFNSINSEYYFVINNKLAARFELEDELRSEAKDSIKQLKKLGFDICILSGDKNKLVKKVADELEIKDIYAELNPVQKADIIKTLRQKNPVVMIGDGINDIAALQAANVGICMGSGASISLEHSDIVLLKDDLNSLLQAAKLSKYTYKVILQNLSISLVYNVLSIPLAMCGLVIPLIAAISMSFSSLLVVLNSLKLRIKF